MMVNVILIKSVLKRKGKRRRFQGIEVYFFPCKTKKGTSQLKVFLFVPLLKVMLTKNPLLRRMATKRSIG